jgi:hypothetical protein
MNRRYGYLDDGIHIIPPEGWKIVPEGKIIPPIHRECVTLHVTSSGEWGRMKWEAPKSRHGKDAPTVACVIENIRAFAIPA